MGKFFVFVFIRYNAESARLQEKIKPLDTEKDISDVLNPLIYLLAIPYSDLLNESH